MAHFGPKNDEFSEIRIRSKDFLKFSTMKGATRYMKIILMFFLKNFTLGQVGLFGLKNETWS